MSDPADASGVISLPKGGGALSGIGEKFSPDLFTGTGNFTVQSSLTAGRNGSTRQTSGAGWSAMIGQSPFGEWTLAIRAEADDS